MSQDLTAYAFLLAGIMACSRATIPSDPEPVPGINPTPVLKSELTWVISPTSDRLSYRSTIVTRLNLKPESVERDSITLHTEYSTAFIQNSGFVTVSGVLEAVTLESGTRVGPAPLPRLPFPFSGRLNTGGLTLESAGQLASGVMPDCSNPALAILTGLQRNLITLPRSISSGVPWTDSSTVRGCSGSIPIVLTAVRTYMPVNETNYLESPALLLERTERLIISGEGSQHQHRVVLSSKGTGAGHIHVDRVTGALLSSESTHSSQVTIVTSGRVQEFLQIVQEKTARIR